MFYYIFYAPISGRRMELKTPFVGAMKIARNVPVSWRLDEWHSPHPSSLPEGVYPVEWWNVKNF